MKEIHKTINKHFRFRTMNDNLPISSPRGNRGNLADCFNELGYKQGVEIGTQYGKYAEILCKQIPGGHLTCIDPWFAYSWIDQQKQDERYAHAVERLTPYINADQLTIIRKTSMDAVHDFEDGSIDYVFIDGNHRFDYVMLDIIFWAQKVRRGGIVACHDYYNFRWSGVVKAVDAYTHCHKIDPWYVTREHDPTAFWVKS